MVEQYLNVIKSSSVEQATRQKTLPSGSSFTKANCLVCFDFDNTITAFDVLDGIIEKFSINRDWVAYEEAWEKGKIGSLQCLEGQLRSIRVTKKDLCSYLSTIEVDPCFKKLLALLNERGIRSIVLSDSFCFLIKYILKNSGITSIPVYSNRFKVSNDRLIPSFPYVNNQCSHCGHCKTSTIASEAYHDKLVIYIGDGLSDVCPAHHADLVFAKNTLLKHFTKTKRDCVAFTHFGDIYNYLKEFFYEQNEKAVFAAERNSAV